MEKVRSVGRFLCTIWLLLCGDHTHASDPTAGEIGSRSRTSDPVWTASEARRAAPRFRLTLARDQRLVFRRSATCGPLSPLFSEGPLGLPPPRPRREGSLLQLRGAIRCGPIVLGEGATYAMVELQPLRVAAISSLWAGDSRATMLSHPRRVKTESKPSNASRAFAFCIMLCILLSVNGNCSYRIRYKARKMLMSIAS